MPGTLPLATSKAADIADRIGAMPVQLVLDEWGTTKDHDEDLLVYAAAIAVAAEESLRRRVAISRSAGATWQEIGDCLAVTRSAAQQRFG